MSGYRRLLARLEASRTMGVAFGLERVRAVLAHLGHPERRFVSVQVAGTNGKGSTAAMAESVLRAAGLRTGLYTSPHLARFTERIHIDGAEANGDRLAEIADRVAAADIPLTFFELATALALMAMAEARVEVAVLETGLGGRLDAVTAVEPAATAITSVGLDHTDLLGGTLREIAREKAGIARPGVALYLGEVPEDAAAEIASLAAEAGAPLRRLGIDFGVPAEPPALPGRHQLSNAALAVALARDAARRLGRDLSSDTVAAGLRSVSWPGRLERVTPDVLLDCAHNPEGARSLGAALPSFPTVLCISIVRGKDVRGILAPLVPVFGRVIATRSRDPRALPPAELAEAARALGARVEIEQDALAALAAARRIAAARPTGLVVVAGSIFLVGELRAHLLEQPSDPIPVGDPLNSCRATLSMARIGGAYGKVR